MDLSTGAMTRTTDIPKSHNFSHRSFTAQLFQSWVECFFRKKRFWKTKCNASWICFFLLLKIGISETSPVEYSPSISVKYFKVFFTFTLKHYLWFLYFVQYFGSLITERRRACHKIIETRAVTSSLIKKNFVFFFWRRKIKVIFPYCWQLSKTYEKMSFVFYRQLWMTHRESSTVQLIAVLILFSFQKQSFFM